jgi:hypothetical protein
MAGGYVPVGLLSQYRNLCLRDNGKEQNNENNRRGQKKEDNKCEGEDKKGK